MAFRIHESVLRGEIDNRVKGIVRGKIWVTGREEPVVLELEGNAWPDLAGCLLTFTNPLKPVPHEHLDSLHSLQKGGIGDLTASRKVRVFDAPLEEALAMIRRGEKPPEHMANCLYLEWFSEANGRVVIESVDYQLAISAPEWRPAAEDEAARAQQAGAGMMNFMKRLSEAVDEQEVGGAEEEEKEWDEHDYERLLRESDARAAKFGELLKKFGDSEEALEKIEEEMGWNQPQFEKEKTGRMSPEEINALLEAAAEAPEPEPDPAREGIDWIRDKSGYLHHPLQHRCTESMFHVREQIIALGLNEASDAALGDFLFEYQTTGAKLAGALGCLARGEPFSESAFTVALLKRALDHLHRAQAGLAAVVEKQLLPETITTPARQELFEIREGILKLMDEYRGRQRGAG